MNRLVSGRSDGSVTLIASSKEGLEPVQRKIKKYILEHECSYLKRRLRPGATEIYIPLRRPKNLHTILKHFYEDEFVVSKKNLESLWIDARTLELVDLQEACIRGMVDTLSTTDSWVQTLQFSQAEGLDSLESNVLDFVRAHFKKCCRSSSFKLLSVDQVAQVLQLSSERSEARECRKIGLIHDWIMTNEAERCSQAHRLLGIVDLTKLTQGSLRLHFTEESAGGHWPKLEEVAGKLVVVLVKPDATNSPKVELAIPESIDHVIIKEELPSDDASYDSNAEDPERNELDEEPALKGESAPSPAKMPRMEYSQIASDSMIQSRRKQILYLRQRSRNKGFTTLDFITISNDVSKPKTTKVNLPNFELDVPKLVWHEEARSLIFLGDVGYSGYELPTAHCKKTDKRALKLAALPSMTTRRHRFQPVILNGRLYVVGGSNSLSYENLNRTSSAEVLDLKAFRTNWKWQPIASMPDRRDLYAATAVAGKVYVIGGLCDTSDMIKERKPVVTNSVVCYEPTENQWKHVRSMNFHRCGHAVAVVGEKIYVFGGSGSKYMKESQDLENMKTAEAYDIREDKWAVIAPMLSSRHGGSAVVVGDKIYVIGGDQRNFWKQMSSVECYDPAINSWTAVCETVDNEGWFNSVAVIDDPKHFLKGHK